jgi:type II secretory pathway component GspD/PulD (secretin)
MRLRFSIRDLLWLTALIAMGIGWWLEHRQWINSDQPLVTVYPIKIADPKMVLKVLQIAYSRDSGVRVGLDETSNSVVVLARPSQHIDIRETILKIEQSRLANPKSIPLVLP